MLKFGFEREYFVFARDELVLPPRVHIPHDGVLAEARGVPDYSPIVAAYALLAEEHRMKKALPSEYRLDTLPTFKVSREMRIENARTEVKGLVHYQNLYGHKRHRHKQSEMTAGLHVSVTRSQSTVISIGPKCSKCDHAERTSQEINIMFDFARFVRIMDEEFKEIIKDSSRRPGFYEIKADGRVEYRSLPTSVDPVVVADFIQSHVKSIHGSW